MWSRPALALLFVLLYLILCAAVWWRHRRLQRAAEAEAAALLPAAEAGPPVLVLHASQTGQAEALAWQTGKFLHLAGMPVRVCALGQVSRQDLLDARHALVIASTYGEGDAPDSAAPFARDLMAAETPLDLQHLQVGVMALGDRTYAHYCGFGRAVAAWLMSCGAQPLFERIEVDREDPAAIALWQQRLSHVAGTADLPDFSEAAGPVFQTWRLVERRHLNPGSQGGPVFHLSLLPPEGVPLPSWEAGDLVQVLPVVPSLVPPLVHSLTASEDPAHASPRPGTGAENPDVGDDEGDDPADTDRTRPREYTIASLSRSGRVELMVRQTRRDDGRLGRASGLLTDHLPIGGHVSLRLRPHPSFRIGDNHDRPLILIGNGTGLAGLRAHLQARAERRPSAGAWLLFGERQSAHDAHYREEIQAWLQTGVLQHVDLAFSRDQPERIHVQHLLAQQPQRLRSWVADGAALYVCGSLQGMAGAVDAVLRDALGDPQMDALIQQGRYRRDVY
ncbi:sulfite reductase flavoprotein subunit alpha [Roseateles sp. SL47]|uniref:sulfite reductase subunit alpha n=1 Tax=Roseateles sp. SL47 TaxID=2995138 RepID=UPI0022720EC5|nr:sulfite reductase flavoprotein subunit alpha [Roseateles sp. SL47]WAC74323.1 sulfite reductase flavoprotein subunit alpha [Roseateles sp. SL47]